MAAHRKPKQQRTFGGSAGRTALTLALAGAATATAFDGSGHAEPRPTPEQLKAKADKLYQEAEEATEKYNGAKEAAGRARKAAEELRDEAARRTERLNASRNALGSIATAQYRAGGLDPAVQLALAADPDSYLAGAELVERAGARQAATVTGIQQQARELAQLRTEAGERLAELQAHQAELARHRTTVRRKLAAAEAVLAQLTADQRTAYAAQDGASGSRAARDAGRSGIPAAPVPAPNPRAAQAVAYAYGALGKPYVWGATGPSSYDCSGLTQAAWRSAGVSLPRTTYTQINAGRSVPRSQLAPGDLVFFYSGVSHVGLYIGAGQMIHAPRPGAPVRIAPIDQMPFAGATRVA